MTRIKGLPDECVWCGARITGWQMWKRHTKLHPKETRRKACEECGQVFTYGGAYKRHMETMHAPEPAYSDGRFFSKVRQDHETGCWVWVGCPTPKGYGLFALRGPYPSVRVSTHKWAYERLIGPVPEGLELDHLCRNRMCCNPLHLEPVTHQVNMQRSVAVRFPALVGKETPGGEA